MGKKKARAVLGGEKLLEVHLKKEKQPWGWGNSISFRDRVFALQTPASQSQNVRVTTCQCKKHPNV